jgi:hypothetical protein
VPEHDGGAERLLDAPEPSDRAHSGLGVDGVEELQLAPGDRECRLLDLAFTALLAWAEAFDVADRAGEDIGIEFCAMVAAFQLSELLPRTFRQRDYREVWLTAYRSVVDGDSESPHEGLEAIGSRVVLVRGSIKYLAGPIVGSLADGTVGVAPEFLTTPPGDYLVIMVPYRSSCADDSDSRIHEQIESVVGLIAAVTGGALAYEFVFSNILNLRKGTTTASTRGLKGPPFLVLVELRRLTSTHCKRAVRP